MSDSSDLKVAAEIAQDDSAPACSVEHKQSTQNVSSIHVLPSVEDPDLNYWAMTPILNFDSKMAAEVKKMVESGSINSNWAEKTEPIGTARAVAEFEDMGGVLIAYPGTTPLTRYQSNTPPYPPRSFGIPNSLIISMQQNDSPKPVHIFILANLLTTEAESIIQSLKETAKQINVLFRPENVHFVPWDTDTYWTRDFGPWWIELGGNTGEYAVAKHTYTSLGGGVAGGLFRPQDDSAGIKLLDMLNAPVLDYNQLIKQKKIQGKSLPTAPIYFLGLLGVGGNYMVTGDGQAASTLLTVQQNLIPGGDIIPTIARIRQQFRDFLGVTQYHLLEDPTGTYIGHIDCWAKFLAKDKVLIDRSTDKDAAARQNAIADQFAKLNFKVFRVDNPSDVPVPKALQSPPDVGPFTDGAYTNSLILNNVAYVPIINLEDFKMYDEAALKVYQEALGPNYSVVGVPGKAGSDGIYGWLGTDALHCRTRGIPRKVVERYLTAKKALKDAGYWGGPSDNFPASNPGRSFP